MTGAIHYREYLRRVISEEAQPLHKHGHQVRLYELSRQVGIHSVYDDDVVFAAVWLHDIGVFDGNRPTDLLELQQWDHVGYAVDRARQILSHTDFPAEKIEQVIGVIKEHQPQDSPTSIEAQIVRDADILEQLGAIAVMRTAAKLGSDTRFLRFSDARNHLRRMLQELPPKLVLMRSKELAEPRLKALSTFLSDLDEEAGDGID
jgi:uncharacterized protein